MASGDTRDLTYGKPYTGTPVQQASREGKVATVLDMYRMAAVTITEHTNDNHYTTNGNLYSE
jgi:hypothetical protein